jgi:hypothetical protein
MVKHITRDGQVLQDITGHKIRKEDAPEIYEILERIRERGERKNGQHHI